MGKVLIMLNKNKFYNQYHKKNVIVQVSIIGDRNYTYQTMITLVNKYLTESKLVLDVGCGVGTIDFYLASKGHSVLGIDVSSKAIKLAKKSAEALGIDSVSFTKIDVAEMSLSHKHDVVICSEVIEHVGDDVELLNSISKILNSGGLLILSTPSINAPLYRLGLLNDFDKRVGHLRRYTMELISEKIAESGLEIVETRKVEGILRNSLYTIEGLGFLVRFIRWPLTPVVSLFDAFFVRLFGESNLYVVARKT